jgi:hypothetical protein
MYIVSFSDWTINVNAVEVTGNDNNNSSSSSNHSYASSSSVDTYHVHRNVLAIGGRRSAYFANLFHYDINDGSSHCTHIVLTTRAAAYFPEFLDYIYSSHAFTITTRNAVALLFLAQAFQVVSLQSQIQEFIEQDIRLYNFGYYMSEAIYFSEENVALKVMDTCGNEVLKLCSDPNLSTILHFPFFATFTTVEEKFQTAWTYLVRLPKALAFRSRIDNLATWRTKLSNSTIHHQQQKTTRK